MITIKRAAPAVLATFLLAGCGAAAVPSGGPGGGGEGNTPAPAPAPPADDWSHGPCQIAAELRSGLAQNATPGLLERMEAECEGLA